MTLCHILPERRGWVNSTCMYTTSIRTHICIHVLMVFHGVLSFPPSRPFISSLCKFSLSLSFSFSIYECNCVMFSTFWLLLCKETLINMLCSVNIVTICVFDWIVGYVSIHYGCSVGVFSVFFSLNIIHILQYLFRC